MMWVKLTLPPRARRRWLLITTRLSAISLAGTARTLVAVGTVSELCMFATTREAAPRRGVVSTAVTSSFFAGASSAGLSCLAAGLVSTLGSALDSAGVDSAFALASASLLGSVLASLLTSVLASVLASVLTSVLTSVL